MGRRHVQEMTMGTAMCYSFPAQFVVSEPVHEAKFTCSYCLGVNRWIGGEMPPSKCRHCGAPEQ